MHRQIPESDWKIFRQLHRTALNRFCEQILSETGALTRESAGTPHERYLKLYQVLARRDKEMGSAFDDLRRSTAFVQIAIMRNKKFITEEEVARFSPETQQILALFQG